MPTGPKGVFQGGGLVLIDLAAQGVYGDLHGDTSQMAWISVCFMGKMAEFTMGRGFFVEFQPGLY